MSDLVPLEAEQALLGAWMADPQSWDLSSDLYRPGMFGGPWHNLIGESIAALLLSGKDADPVLVARSIPEPEGENVERPISYILRLAGGVGSGAMARHYAEEVRKAWAVREARAILGNALETGERDADKLIALVTGQLAMIESGSARELRSMADDCMDFAVALDNERLRKPGTEIRSTGYDAVDQVTGGLENGLPHLMAARPGQGKSAYAVGLCRYAAGALKEPTGLLWFEDTRRKAMLRLAAAEARIPAISLRHGTTVDPQNWPALMRTLDRVAKWPLVIESTKGLTPRQVAAVMRRMHREKGVKRFFCDHLSKMALGIDEDDKRGTTLLGNAFILYQETLETLASGGVMFHQLGRIAEKGGEASGAWLYDSDLLYQAARVVGYLSIKGCTTSVVFPKVTYGPGGLSVELGWEPVYMSIFNPQPPEARPT